MTDCAKTYKLLIVEDFKTNREILSRMLAEEGYKFDVAEDGVKALEKIREGGFDLVLLDIVMPEMDGYEVLRIMKDDPKLRHIPVIMLTALDLISSAAKCIEMGAEDYIAKPFDPILLRARISSSLERKRLRDKEEEYRKSIEEQNALLEERVKIQVRQITERWKAEESLRKAKDVAEQENKLKDQFVSLVSHDLRSPLASAISLLRLTLTNQDAAYSQNERDILNRTLTSLQGQVNMIDQLLNVTRLRTGKIVPEPRYFDAGAIVSEAIDSLIHLAELKGIAVKNEIPLKKRLFADADLFYQVIQNLFSNAIKFCRDGDEISFFIPNDKKSAIAIKDTGVGIKKALLPNLFRHEIKTSTPGTEGEKGTGLGLPFCSDIMAAHGGTLSVDSAEGVGTTFFAELPSRSATVLIVDAQKTVRHIYRKYLEAFEAEVAEVGTGQEALDFVRKAAPRLVITSLQLPDMDGFDVIAGIRENAATVKTPIIVATASTEIEIREKAFALGVNDFVTKPIMDHDFIPRVRRFLG